jgi:hypothetical protein
MCCLATASACGIPNVDESRRWRCWDWPQQHLLGQQRDCSKRLGNAADRMHCTDELRHQLGRNLVVVAHGIHDAQQRGTDQTQLVSVLPFGSSNEFQVRRVEWWMAGSWKHVGSIGRRVVECCQLDTCQHQVLLDQLVGDHVVRNFADGGLDRGQQRAMRRLERLIVALWIDCKKRRLENHGHNGVHGSDCNVRLLHQLRVRQGRNQLWR